MAGVLPVTPFEDPSNYNKITVAGIDSGSLTDPPILVEVTGADRPFNWDVKRSAGSQGQTITYRGWDLAKPKIKFKCWTSGQIKAVQNTLIPVMFYDAEKAAPKPYDIYHPKLFANLIFWLVTEKVGEWLDEGSQLWTCTVECLEYRQAKAKNATSTPETANSNQDGKNTKPTVQDEQDKEISRLTALFREPT